MKSVSLLTLVLGLLASPLAFATTLQSDMDLTRSRIPISSSSTNLLVNRPAVARSVLCAEENLYCVTFFDMDVQKWSFEVPLLDLAIAKGGLDYGWVYSPADQARIDAAFETLKRK